jgi:Peptidase_C39 like family
LTRTFRMWLQSAVLGISSVATFGVLAFGPSGAAHAAAPAEPAPAGANAMVPHQTALQPNGYYCAPSATRIALSAHGQLPSPDQLAGELGTTPDGTRSANDVTRVLNAHLGGGRYKTVEISGQKASPEQVATLQRDIMTAVGRGDAVVANIAGTVTDTAGDSHSYQGGHYLTVIAYSDGGQTVQIADPADKVGTPEYKLPVGTLANWIASRGYSA